MRSGRVVAITGGVACGKSSVTRFLEQYVADSIVFNCDDEVSNLLTDSEVVGKLGGELGEHILNEDGTLNRSVLRDLVFSSAENREKVEGILHPKVLELAVEFCANAKPNQAVLTEIPLLYEVDFPINRDIDLVIGCSQERQISRITENRGLDRETAINIITAQLPIEKKIERADCVIWNDGGYEPFEGQITRFADLYLG